MQLSMEVKHLGWITEQVYARISEQRQTCNKVESYFKGTFLPKPKIYFFLLKWSAIVFLSGLLNNHECCYAYRP